MEEGAGVHPPACLYQQGTKRTKALGPKPHYHYFAVRFPLGSDMHINLNMCPQRIEDTFWKCLRLGSYYTIYNVAFLMMSQN